MYQSFPWKLFTDPLGSAEAHFGKNWCRVKNNRWYRNMFLLSGWWQTLLRTGTILRAHMLRQHWNYTARERLFPSHNLCRAGRQTWIGEG